MSRPLSPALAQHKNLLSHLSISPSTPPPSQPNPNTNQTSTQPMPTRQPTPSPTSTPGRELKQLNENCYPTPPARQPLTPPPWYPPPLQPTHPMSDRPPRLQKGPKNARKSHKCWVNESEPKANRIRCLRYRACVFHFSFPEFRNSLSIISISFGELKKHAAFSSMLTWWHTLANYSFPDGFV